MPPGSSGLTQLTSLIHVRRCPLQRAAAAGRHAHVVDARAQQDRQPAGAAELALGRREDLPGDEEDRGGRDAAHHVQRVAAHHPG